MNFKELMLEDLESSKNLRDFIHETNSKKKLTDSEKKIFLNSKSRKRFDSLDYENPLKIYEKKLIKKILKFEKPDFINFEDNSNFKIFPKSRKNSVIDIHEFYFIKKKDKKKKKIFFRKKNLKEENFLENYQNEDILNFSDKKNQKIFQLEKKNDFILKMEKNKEINFENSKTSLILIKKEISKNSSFEEKFEISKLSAKITKVSNFWSKKTFFIPNVFKLIKKIDNNDFLFESQDLSNKELLIQSNGLKSKITEKNFNTVLIKKNDMHF